MHHFTPILSIHMFAKMPYTVLARFFFEKNGQKPQILTLWKVIDNEKGWYDLFELRIKVTLRWKLKLEKNELFVHLASL